MPAAALRRSAGPAGSTAPSRTSAAPEHLLLWQRLEAAKHRLVYGLLRLGLPLVSRVDDPDAGLAFDFLADPDPTWRTARRS